MRWTSYPGFQLGHDARGLTLRWRRIATAMDAGFVVVFLAACIVFEVAIIQSIKFHWMGMYLSSDPPSSNFEAMAVGGLVVLCMPIVFVLAARRLCRVCRHGSERLRINTLRGEISTGGDLLCRTRDVLHVLLSYSLPGHGDQTVELRLHPPSFDAELFPTGPQFIHVAGLASRVQADSLADALGGTIGVPVFRLEPSPPIERTLGFPVIAVAQPRPVLPLPLSLPPSLPLVPGHSPNTRREP